MRARILVLALGLLAPGAALLWGGPAAAEDKQPADDVEALARGPVHEAFAEPVDYKPQPGPVVTKQPPDPIEETPPDQKPEGDNVVWVPGYWAWDGDSKDYLWVSGFWRDEPPGQRWVPGAWQEVEGGWQWSPGFWQPEKAEQVDYVPYPPPTIDAGPSTPPPNSTDVYVPGCWMWRDTRFLWRPGYWVAYRPEWVWVPARYVWTPGGCVFIDGYWDRPLEARGLLFAPVRIDRRVIVKGWTYTPLYVVRPDFLLTALFVGPARHHYYFGDFFADTELKRGFVPWVDYHPTKHTYDPIFTHVRLGFRDEPAWDRNLRELYRARFSGDAPRPPHTIVEQQKVVQNLTVNKTTNVNVIKNVNVTNVQVVSALAPMKEVHNVKVTNLAGLAPAAKAEPVRTVKLQAVSKEQVAQEKKRAELVREVVQKRREVEAKLVADGGVHTVKPGENTKPAAVKFELPRPPAPAEKPKTAVKAPPPPPTLPKHEEKAVPAHEPPKPPAPPKKEAKPPEPPKKETPPPPKKEEKPAPPKPEKPAEAPKKETPPPPPKKEEKPAPPKPEKPAEAPKKETPPPPPKKEEKPAPPPKPEPPKAEKPPAPPKKESPPPPKKEDKPPEPPKKDTAPKKGDKPPSL